MDAVKSVPLPGYNTNVRQGAIEYHIQTEDAGAGSAAIVTHVFADGGRVIGVKKQTYTEHIGQPGFQGVVRKLMQDQHKTIFLLVKAHGAAGPDALGMLISPNPIRSDTTDIIAIPPEPSGRPEAISMLPSATVVFSVPPVMADYTRVSPGWTYQFGDRHLSADRFDHLIARAWAARLKPPR